MKRYKLAALSLVVTSSLAGCANKNESSGSNTAPNTGTQPSKGQSSTLKPTTTQSSIKNVSIDEAKKLIDTRKDLVIIDVSTEQEYKKGHINNAIFMPYEQIASRIGEIEKYKDRPVLLYCRSGNRSAVATQSLEKRGFTNIYHMNEGTMNWKYDLVK